MKRFSRASFRLPVSRSAGRAGISHFPFDHICFRSFESQKSKVANPRAFTILELLVATAVMTLLLTLLLQVANYTLQASKTATQQLDSTQSARKVLDVLSSDIANALTMEGATLLTQNAGSLSLAFLTSGRGPDATPTRLLAVNYRMEGDQIMRRYNAIGWEGASDLLDGAITAAGVPSSSVLATGILQFAVLALLDNGEMVSILAPPGNAAGASGTILFEGRPVPTGWTALVPSRPPLPAPLNLANSRVRALLVAIASVDEQNLRLLSADQKAVFVNDPEFSSDPVAVWEAALQAGSFPAPARSAVRFHSRVIPLP